MPRFRSPVVRRAVVLVLALLLALPMPVAAAVEYGAATPEELVARLNRAAESGDFADLAACLAPEDRAAMTMVLILGAGMMTAFAQMGAGLAEGMAEMGAEMAEGMAEGLAEAMGGEVATDGDETDGDETAEDETAWEETAEGEEALAEAAAEAEAAAAAEAAASAEMAALSAQASDLSARFEALLEKHGVTELMEQETDPAAAGPEAAAAALAGIDQVALIADLMKFMSEAFPDAAGEEAAPVPVPPGELSGLVVEGDTARGRIGEEEVDFVRVDGRWYIDLPDEMAPGAEQNEEAAP